MCGFFVALMLLVGSLMSTDAQIRTGVLRNGYTYYIRANELPKNQVHVALVQKPFQKPVYHNIALAPQTAEEAVEQLYNFLKEGLASSPQNYRPHKQAIIIVGALHADSLEGFFCQKFSDLPASVDVLQAKPEGSYVVNRKVGPQRPSGAKPLAPFYQSPLLQLELSSRLPTLTREMRSKPIYYVNDFMSYALEQSGGFERTVSEEDGGGELFLTRRVPSAQLSEALYQMASTWARRVYEGISSAQVEQARERYLLRSSNEYKSHSGATHQDYIARCTAHFLWGTPLPSARWKAKFLDQLIPLVTLDQVNRFASWVFKHEEPQIRVQNPFTKADSLMVLGDYAPARLLARRDSISHLLDSLDFPVSNHYIDLTYRLSNIEQRLYVDSLGCALTALPTADSLHNLFIRAIQDTYLGTVQELKPAFETLPPTMPLMADTCGTVTAVASKTPLPLQGAFLWELTSGARLYYWPDSLNCGNFLFAAVERETYATLPLFPRQVFETGLGPLEWKFSHAGMVLKGGSGVEEAASFFERAGGVLNALVQDTTYYNGLQQQYVQRREGSERLSGNLLLDTLSALVSPQAYRELPRQPKGFDYVVVGNISPGLLDSLASRFLACVPYQEAASLEAQLSQIPLRKGTYQKTIPFRNAAQESKAARVYSGLCPYTLEQFVLLNVVEQLLKEALQDVVFVQAMLSSQPLGYYYMYMGYAVPASQQEYTALFIDRVLSSLATSGPTPMQLQQARKTLRISSELAQLSPAFRLESLCRYGQSGKDFLTGYRQALMNIDRATVRDFVRQMLEQGNTACVTLQGGF